MSWNPMLARNSPAESEFLETIQHQSERLRDLIHQLLDLARIQSGAGQWMLEDTDLTDVVRSAADMAPEDVSLDLPEGACRFRGGASRIRLMIDSLIDNARKFSPDQCASVTLRSTDLGYEIRVADRGPGMPDEDKSRIFDKFVQLGDVLTDRPDGTGLGLAICKEIVKAHGGQIRCEDNKIGGAVFVVLLPNCNPDAPRLVDRLARKWLARLASS
jgi:signal transduction histidine kinase